MYDCTAERCLLQTIYSCFKLITLCNLPVLSLVWHAAVFPRTRRTLRCSINSVFTFRLMRYLIQQKMCRANKEYSMRAARKSYFAVLPLPSTDL